MSFKLTRGNAVRYGVHIRFLDKWNGEGRLFAQCNLFYGLPTPSMRAWIAAGALPRPQAIDNCNEIAAVVTGAGSGSTGNERAREQLQLLPGP